MLSELKSLNLFILIQVDQWNFFGVINFYHFFRVGGSIYFFWSWSELWMFYKIISEGNSKILRNKRFCIPSQRKSLFEIVGIKEESKEKSLICRKKGRNWARIIKCMHLLLLYQFAADRLIGSGLTQFVHWSTLDEKKVFWSRT